MDLLPNSRRVNDKKASTQTTDMNVTEIKSQDQFSYLNRKKHNRSHQVSKSLKNLFMKFKGTPQNDQQEMNAIILNNKQILTSNSMKQTNKKKTVPSLTLHSKQSSYIKPKNMIKSKSIKNYQLPLIESANLRRFHHHTNSNRHILDLTNINPIDETNNINTDVFKIANTNKDINAYKNSNINEYANVDSSHNGRSEIDKDKALIENANLKSDLGVKTKKDTNTSTSSCKITFSNINIVANVNTNIDICSNSCSPISTGEVEFVQKESTCHGIRRANSLGNSSIYYTFSSSPIEQDIKLSSTCTLSSTLSSSSSTYSLNSCIKQKSTATSRNRNLQTNKILTSSKFHETNPQNSHNTMVNDVKNDSSSPKNYLSSIQQKHNGTINEFFFTNSLFQQQEQYFRTQQRLWKEDSTLCPKEEIAEYLGSNSPSRSKILFLYMGNFNFTDQKLDGAFRTLCTKLYLKAESQQIDRIIEAFSSRYYECNPETLFYSVDVIHAVAYSLLLLNTDLHVVNEWGNKMTKSSFIKNTMETIQSIVFPHLTSSELLRQRRASVKSMDEIAGRSFSAFITFNDDDIPNEEYEVCGGRDSCDYSNSSKNHNGGMGHKLDALRLNMTKKNISNNYMNTGFTRTQRLWLIEIESVLKEMYNSVKAHQIDQADLTGVTVVKKSVLQRAKTLPKRDDKNGSLRRKRRGQSTLFHHVDNKSTLDDLFKVKEATNHNSKPNKELCKKGLVMRKHVMESTDKRARNRQWQLCYLVVTDKELIMYRPISMEEGTRRRKSMPWNTSYSLRDIMQCQPHWQGNEKQEPLGTIKINHTYTTIIPSPGWNSQRPYVFRLETSDGGLWLFESTDATSVKLWTDTCNLAAAKISKGPLPGAISNIDYGWGVQLNTDSQDSNDVPVWYAPSACMIDSKLSIYEQFNDIERQIEEYSKQLDEHNSFKIFIDRKLTVGYEDTINSIQALNNWNKKLHFILHELIKLRCYQDTIRSQLV